MPMGPALLENAGEYWVYVLIFLGALGGSVKASVEDEDDDKCHIRILNILIGIFCGIMVASHYKSQVSPFLAGIISLTVASVSVVLIESLLKTAPDMLSRLLDYWVSARFKK